MSGESSDIAIARIDATLQAIKQQIDFSERSSAQLVRLVDERFSSRFDTLDKRLEEMDRSRQEARAEHDRQMEKVLTRVAELERWRDTFMAKLSGVAIGAGLFSGGVVVGALKLLGLM